jgi:putative redox protein
MADAKPPMTVSLVWDGNLRFTGHAGPFEVPIDGATTAAASPMQHLALAVAGCMAVDLVVILTRGRHTLSALGATFTGERTAVEPKRFTKIALHFTLATDAAAAVVDRAIQLSRDKYCSVWNSLRQDTELTVTYDLRNA